MEYAGVDLRWGGDGTSATAVSYVMNYLESFFGRKVDLQYFGPLDKGVPPSIQELKLFGYGTPYLVSFTVGGEKKELIISTVRIGRGFGHDYRSDRIASLVEAFDTWNSLPAHARTWDMGAFTRDGKLITLGNSGEFFLLREKVEGTEYYKLLDAVFASGTLSDLDRARTKALSDYLVQIHAAKKQDRELYLRKIRDTVGHGECIFGLADSYPPEPDFLEKNELELIETKCVEHRWRLREKHHRLSQVHGDFHPWNVLFGEGVDFRLLDRSRGKYGEPADDLAAMSINYIFYALRKYGRLQGEFEQLFHIFFQNYLDRSGDREILEALPLFYTFRCLVIASPLWYPTLSKETRRRIFNLVRNLLENQRFDPGRVNDYLESPLG